MTDPLSITAGVLAVGGFALKSSATLYDLIRSFHSQNKNARALKAEVQDLNLVLESLLETVAHNPELDFRPLELPLERCGHACEEYRLIIEKCTQHSGDGESSRRSVRDWVTQKYLQGDIDDFKTMLASYKATINIAMANANLRIARVPPDLLEKYKDMISDTTNDLGVHLEEIQAKVDRLQQSGDAAAVDEVALEWHSILEEKESTQRGLEICAQLSAQIAQFESESRESTQFADRPSAHKHVKSGLNEAGGSIKSLVTRLQGHEASINTQLEALSLKDGLSEPVATQLARLQETKDSISKCIEIVSQAQESAMERSNIFEDITLEDNSYSIEVSTVNDLVTARRLNLKDRSRHFGGQVGEETAQKFIESLTQLDKEHLKYLPQTSQARDTPRAMAEKSTDSRQFNDRHGPGLSLSKRSI